eukprot:jgi/Tetstr1/455135/TSEL_041987.t1
MAACAPRRLPCTPDTDFHDPTSTPLDTKLFPYPNVVGSLIWLAVASRPEIAFVVGRMCAYMASPTERHWQIAVSVLRYLKGTPNHGLIFRKQLDNEAPDFLFFVDDDWATFMPKRRSTTGYLALVHGTPVAYRAFRSSEERGPVYCRGGVRGALHGLQMSGVYSRSSAPAPPPHH